MKLQKKHRTGIHNTCKHIQPHVNGYIFYYLEEWQSFTKSEKKEKYKLLSSSLKIRRTSIYSNKRIKNKVKKEKENISSLLSINLLITLPKKKKRKPVSRATKLKIKKSHSKRKIYCLNNNKTYLSLRDASKDTAKHREGISNCCNGLQRHVNKYIFMYQEEWDKLTLKEKEERLNILNSNLKIETTNIYSKIPENKRKRKRKSFVCLQNNKEYKTINEALIDLNLTSDHASRGIRKVLSGNRLSYKGYSFVYPTAR